ncbi:MAG: hypothetical protein NUW37_20300 [Planctomycetes bacterium]|nr:hypothetical protein [Planctomycetota bacterium]
MTIEATFGGIGLIEAEFELRTGVNPGTGVLMMAGDKTPPVEGTLRFRDRKTSVAIPGLIVVRTERIEGYNRSAVYKLHVADRRHLWRARTVVGRFNWTDSAGTGYAEDTTNDGSPYTWAEIFAFVLAEVGEASPSGLPRVDATPADVHFDRVSAAKALESLLDFAGLELSLDVSGRLNVFERDSARTQLPADTFLKSYSTVRANSGLEYPSRVRITGGLTQREQTFDGEWIPVCLDDGSGEFAENEVRPLSDVVASWGMSLGDVRRACLFDEGFSYIATGADDAEKEKRAQILRRCAFRWYQVPEERRTTLPWLETRAEVDENSVPLPVKIEHSFFRGIGREVEGSDDPFENVTSLQVSSIGRSVDLCRGIVMFDRVVGHLGTFDGSTRTLEGRSVASGAQIELTTSYSLKGSDRSDFYVYEESVHGADKTSASTLDLSDDSLVLRERIVEGVVTQQNRAELDARAKGIIELYRKSRFRESVSAEFAGAHGVNPRGDCDSVKLCASKDGLVTSVRKTMRVDLSRRGELPAIVRRRVAPGRTVTLGGGDSDRGHTYRHVNVSKLGPIVAKTSGNVILAESAIFAEASDIAADGVITFENHGPWRTPFFLDREGAGNLGGWHESALVRIVGASAEEYSVTEAGHLGSVASGAVTIAARAIRGAFFASGDLAILRESFEGEKYLLPLASGAMRLIVDNRDLESKLSAIAFATSNAGVDFAKSAGLDSLFRVFESPLASGSFVLGLGLGASGDSVRIGTEQGAGFLTDVLALRHGDLLNGSGAAILTGAEFLQSPDHYLVGPLAFFDGEVNPKFASSYVASGVKWRSCDIRFTGKQWAPVFKDLIVANSEDPADSTHLAEVASAAAQVAPISTFARVTTVGSNDVAGLYLHSYLISGAGASKQASIVSDVFSQVSSGGTLKTAINANSFYQHPDYGYARAHVTGLASGTALLDYGHRVGSFSFDQSNNRFVVQTPIGRTAPTALKIVGGYTSSGVGATPAGRYQAQPFFNASGGFPSYVNVYNIGSGANVLTANFIACAYFDPPSGVWWCNYAAKP